MKTPEYHDDEFWQKALDSLDVSGLPLPPLETPPVPLTEHELCQKIWDEADDFKKWDRYYANMPQEQPDFGESHLRNPEELQPGMILVSVTTENRWVQEIIIIFPYKETGNGFAGYEWIYYKDWKERNQKHVLFSHISSYADSGLLPYDDSSPRAAGKWHQFNHLCSTGEFLSEKDYVELAETEQEPESRSMVAAYGPFGGSEEIKDRYRRLYGLKKRK